MYAWRIGKDGVAQPLASSQGDWRPAIRGGAGQVVEAPGGRAWLEPVPDFPGTWVQVGPGGDDGEQALRAHAAAGVLAEILRGEREAGLVASELATRYEEIDLLYTIADILARTVRLDEATQTICREVADVVGARRASIMVYDQPSHSLRMVAGRGLERFHTEPVSVDTHDSIAATVFRERRMMSFDASMPGKHPGAGGEPRGYKGTSFLSLPIIYQPPGGEAHPIGVFNLTDRIGADAFTAGHKKLLAAIANQIGAALENARLVENERRRVRLDTELGLAHNLQSALMQPQAQIARGADIGARTESAEVVGGDFYKLLRVRHAVGVLMGDVSSHGLSAAMLMTHVIAAAGIIAQAAQSPERALRRLLEEIGDELDRAEMHVSLFYGIIDKRRGMLRYANAGHPQAFLVRAEGGTQRLAATAPPLGLGDGSILGDTVPWHAGSDVLCLFSDGFSETANAEGERYGEERLLNLVRARMQDDATTIVDAAFEDIARFTGPSAALADDRTLVIIRR